MNKFLTFLMCLLVHFSTILSGSTPNHYVNMNHSLEERVEGFYQDNLSGHTVIGVDYHSGRNRLLQKNVDQLVGIHCKDSVRVFATTNDPIIINYIRNMWSTEDCIVFSPKDVPHTKSEEKILIDLLFEKSDAIVYTDSHPWKIYLNNQ